MIQFSAPLVYDDQQLYSYHILIPNHVMRWIRTLNTKRLMCSINGSSEVHTSYIAAGQGRFFIKVNKELRSTLDLSTGCKCDVVLSEDQSQYGMPCPVEMEEILHQDPEADLYFHALSPGKQRNLLYLVNKARKSDTRIHRAIVIVEHLKERRGDLNFRILNQDFKDKKR